MFKKTFVFCCIALLYASPSFCYAPPARAWQQTIGGSSSDNGTKMLSDGVGGFWLLGTSDSNNGNVPGNNGSTDGLLVHTNEVGSIVQTINFGGTGIDIANDFLLLSNGNLVVTGYTNSPTFCGTSLGGYDGFLLCMDTTGLILWSSRFGGSNADLINNIGMNGSGFVVTGGTYSSLPGNPSHGDQDFWVVQLDQVGSLLWQKNYGGSGLDISYSSIFQNGIITAAGLSNSINQDVSGNHGGLDVWLISIDEANGALLSQHCYGGSSNEAVFNMKLLSNGSIALSGYSRSSNGDLTSNYGFNDAWIFLLDSAKNIIQQKNFGGSGSDAIYAMQETADGLLLSCSSTSTDVDVSNNNGLEDIWMIKLDFNLNIIWSRSFGGAANDRPSSVIGDASDVITILGYSLSNTGDVSGNHGGSDFWLIHLECLAPEVNISGNTALTCAGDTVRLVDQSQNIGSKQWYLNNSLLNAADTLNLTIGNAGNYVVSLSGKTCAVTDSTAYPFTLNNCSPPTADFTSNITSVCQNSSIQFTDQSLLASNVEWQFPGGDPSFSNDPNPIVNYPAAGTYEVILTAFNMYGNSTLTRSSYVVVNPPPAAPVIIINGNNLFCNTNLPLEWYTNGSMISTDQLISNVANGNYNAIVTDANGCTVSTDTIQLSVSIPESIALSGVKIYPNPVADYLTIHATENISITLQDATGRILKEAYPENQSLTIPMQTYPSGIYYLKINVNGKLFYKPVIKQ